MDNLKEIFPIKDKYAYFMTAASGPLPRRSHEAMIRFSELLMNTGSVEFPQWLKILEHTRKSAAKLFGCHSDNLAFVKNTGVGLWIASRVPDWTEGDEIILPAGEFPSNIFPWLSLEESGVTIKWVEPDEGHPIPGVTRKTVAPLITDKSKLLAVSFVQFDDGARRDMFELGQLCKEHGLIFVIDAIQGLGALPFSCEDIGADFVVSGSQKWLLSPPGCGLLYVAPKWLEQARIPNFGWLSVEDPFNTNPGAFAECKNRVLPDARRYEEGTANFPGIAALGESIDYILEVGVENIALRIKNLTDRLVIGLEELDCRVVSPRLGDQWSGIVAFEHATLDSMAVDRQFLSENIITTVRAGWVRVAVDFFNDEEEIDKLLSSLRRQLDGSFVH